MAVGSEDKAESANLVSFVPRLTLEWLRDSPERRWLELEGSLVFVDISGFTAMSERLASLGRAGAEEVTDVIDRVFGELLSGAYAEGGGLLKFGGDALLLLYDGESHARRAARAAFEMRRTLRAIGRLQTSAGAVSLAMHVGVNSGLINFFLVGESHRELVVTGPAASGTVEMESASEAGEILVSPATAALLTPGTLGEDRGAGRLLRAAPKERGSLVAMPPVDGVPLELAVPPPLRAQLLEVGPLEGEHRQATIGFVGFFGTDALIAAEGPVAAAERLDGLVRTVQEAADEHGVTFLYTDVDRDGGKIVLVSGAPQTFGDDEERLLRTVRAAVDAGLPLPVHVGVHRGRVFTGQVGAPFRRTYTALGDTVNVAARLMARAGENEIYVSNEVLERGGGCFAVEELEPFMVKGKTEPIRAFLLGELRSGRAAADAGEHKLPFVDRERERAVLAASVAPVRMGFGTIVELVGEPGIGKSRLADELREQCSDMNRITVRCEQYEASTPYHAFRPFLRSLLDVELNGGGEHNRAVLAERLGTLDSELVPWAPLLAAPLDVEVETTPEVEDLDQSFRRARLHGVLGTLLAQLLAEPTLLVFDDVHWMDDASSELLRHLGTQLSTRPWLACTTRRPGGGGFLAAEGTPPLPALTLRLEALPPEDAKTLVRAAAGERKVSEQELAAIAERAAGNPLFLQELALPAEEAEAAEQLPETVEALVATRIDRLAPRDRTLLRWASVLGESFSGALVGEVLEQDPSGGVDPEAWDRLAEYVERDPSVAGGFRFRHGLIRQAAYDGLSYRRRRELHGRVAEVIERHQHELGDSVELLSLHFHRAQRWTESWHYSVEAGRRAQAKWANLEAAEFYRRALDGIKHVPSVEPAEVATVWEALGDCLQLAGEFDDAAQAFAAARRLVPKDSPELVELMHKEGRLREDMGRYSEAIRWYSNGVKSAERIQDEVMRSRLRIKMMMGSAWARYRQGKFRDCIRLANEVVEGAHAIGEDLQLGRAYTLLHAVYMMMGAPERVAFRGLALPILEDVGDLKGQATALNNLGIDAYYEGEWLKALDLYRRSHDVFERLGDVTSAAMATNNIAEILADQGRLEKAQELFREVQEAAGANRGISAVALLNLGRAAARAGRFDEAESLLCEVYDSFVEMNAASYVLETDVRRAETDALRGDRAEEAFERAEAVLAAAGEAADSAALRAAALRIKGTALLQLGRKDEAVAVLTESARIADEASIVYEKALSLDLIGGVHWGYVHDGSAEAAESRELLERLDVERITRPPLADGGGGAEGRRRLSEDR